MIWPSPAVALVVGALVIAGVGAVAGKEPGKRTETEKETKLYSPAGFPVGTVPAASVVVTIDPTVVASERMDRFNLYDLLLPAGDPVVTLDAVVGPGVGGFVVADGPEVVTADIIPDTRYNVKKDTRSVAAPCQVQPLGIGGLRWALLG